MQKYAELEPKGCIMLHDVQRVKERLNKALEPCLMYVAIYETCEMEEEGEDFEEPSYEACIMQDNQTVADTTTGRYESLESVLEEIEDEVSIMVEKYLNQ